jgi:hypothetical protein
MKNHNMIFLKILINLQVKETRESHLFCESVRQITIVLTKWTKLSESLF